jgi:hypothetical protein
VSQRAESRRVDEILRVGSVAGILLLMAGCHSDGRSNSLLERLSSAAPPKASNLGPNHLAAEGLASITSACEKQSFENARTGLIVSQTGLHEDVFAMRSRTYSSVAFSLDDALKLEDVLRNELKANKQPEQRECVQQFEGYLETLTDPIVEQDKLAKDLDASAFKDSSKEAQEELRREKEVEALAPKK